MVLPSKKKMKPHTCVPLRVFIFYNLLILQNYIPIRQLNFEWKVDNADEPKDSIICKHLIRPFFLSIFLFGT